MCGSETLAMLVSSTSMNVASVTVNAMSQGLCRGRHSSLRADLGSAVACSPDLDLGLDRHAGTQREPVGRWSRTMLDRHALDDLDVVARGVLRRQEAEARARAGRAVDVALKRCPG